LWGKNISPNFTDSQEPEPHAKKQEPEPLGKKSVAGAAKKKSQEPELLKKITRLLSPELK